MQTPDSASSRHSDDEAPPVLVYKYTSVAVARIILATRSLRFHSPLLFNDPLDTQWNPMWQLATSKTKKAIEQMFIRAVSTPSEWPHNLDQEYRQLYKRAQIEWLAQPLHLRDKWLEKQAVKFANPKDSDALPRKLLSQRAALRVACMSALCDSILMWSHYGDQHRGVVLGFRADRFPKDRFGTLKKVRYQDDLPELCSDQAHAASVVYGTDPSWKQDDGDKLVLTKFKSWEYEQEWRFVLQATPEELGEWEDISFPPDALASIIIGARTDSVRARELFAFALRINKDAELRAFGVHPTKFALVERREPWKNIIG